MARAVRFDEYGGVEVLRVVEVEPPVPGPGQVLVRVKAAAINPGEAAIRRGVLHDRFPATFPSGEGTDLAGVVEEVGEGVGGVAVGDEVLGYTYERSSHAELVVTEATKIVPKPAGVPWDVAGSLFVAGTAAYASVRAVAPTSGDTVVVSGAAGGVGSLAVQLARNTGAVVIGLASEANHTWLSDHGVIPVTYGDGVVDRIQDAAPGGKVDAFIDTFGDGYVDLALELGVAPERVNTIIDFAAAARHDGVKTDGNASADTPDVLTELAGLVAAGRLEVPIARTYPLDQVQDAFREIEPRHTHGKIVLHP
jgi:NADPH:quinone reductase-like Zn-dependent oxidoreductase